MKKVTVHAFAQLKDYFGEEVTLYIEEEEGIKDLINHLKMQRPDSEELLANCRLADKEEFIDTSHPLEDGAHIYFYPPSSGG